MIGENLKWKKSSFSEGGGACVEVVITAADGVHVRDSKNPGGPTLWFTAMEWTAFLYGVLAGEFGLR